MKLTEPTQEEIFEILSLVDESDIDELRLEIGGLKLIVGKGAYSMSQQALEPAPSVPTRLISQEAPSEAKTSQQDNIGASEPIEQEVQPTEPDQIAPVEEEGLIPITAPLLGIFYGLPKPGDPPFAEVGTYVTEDSTVCLIEVMKLFTAVKAGVRGRIAKICVETDQLVQYQQTLFLIEPGESPEEDSKV